MEFDLRKIKMRRHLSLLINERRYITGLEIGVFKGGFSRLLLDHTCLEILYCVDPWNQKFLRKNVDAEVIRSEAMNNLAQDIVTGRCRIVRKTSSEAVKLFEEINLKFDFIFVDGNHDYKHVTDDLNNYWRLLNVNGCMAGHDYTDYYRRGGLIRKVKSAVNDFVRKNKLKLHLTYMDSPKTWYIFKG